MEKKTDWSERGKMGLNAFPFWSKQSKRGNLKYWHFASTTCRQCLQLAGRVYLWCTVSTDPRPPTPYMRVNDCSGPFWGKGPFGPLPKYWHFASTTCRQCLQLVYSVYMCVCVCVYIYIHTYIYTYICRMTLYDASYCVVLCRTVSYCVVQCRTVSYCVVLCRTVSYRVVQCRTVSYCVVLCRTVSYSVYIHTYIYIYMSYDTVRRVVLCRTVSYCVVLCRTVSYSVVQCRTVSYCVVLCRTVSYCVVLCRTVSYCVVLCRTSVVRHCTTRRTVSYSVVQCRTVSYSVVRHCTTRRTVSYKVSGPDASGMYDASYSVVQGVGARRVGDVRRVGRCRGPTRRKIPTSTVVQSHAHSVFHTKEITSTSRTINNCGGRMFTGGPDVRNSHVSDSNISRGGKSHQNKQLWVAVTRGMVV